MQKRKISELDSKRKINKMKNEVELEAGTIDDIKPIFRVVIQIVFKLKRPKLLVTIALICLITKIIFVLYHESQF